MISSSARSAAACSVRPPASNASMLSLRCFSSLRRIGTHSSSDSVCEPSSFRRSRNAARMLRSACRRSFCCARRASFIWLLTLSKIDIARVCHSLSLLALGVACVACAADEPVVFRGEVLGFGGGPERYSSWFGDERNGVIYFGLSPFWTDMRAHGGDPTADLLEPSAHLIGRFEIERERFLPPLLVRRPGPDSRSSVWDVLAHPNGWVYYTTYFEEMGRVRPGMGDVERFDDLGPGLNELALGPDRNLYVTRYGAEKKDGGVAVISPEGKRVREAALHAVDGALTAPKSIAVDPLSGDVF